MPTAEWTDTIIDTSDDTVRALQLILTAWDEGEESGVAPELMAYAAIFAAMTDLVTLFGEDAVAKMAGSLEQRVKLGEFSLRQSRH